MDFGFWQNRWSTAQIGFHQSVTNPHLTEHADWLAPTPTDILVPLCGKSRDMAWLASRGNAVVGIEFVAEAARAFFEENGVHFTERDDAISHVLVGENVTIRVGDFFEIAPRMTNAFAAVFDRAALVACKPNTREAYVASISGCMKPGGRALVVTFDYDGAFEGPPFSVTEQNTRALWQPYGSIEKVAHVDITSESARMVERGATQVREQAWQFQKRPLTIP